MAEKLIKVGDSANSPCYQYVIDTASDLPNLEAVFGNIALCLDDQKIYVCNSTGEWKEM